jgi:nucleotide-binding universal stress UspA family protein
MKPTTVLVPLDGSVLAEKALAPAIGFARESASLVLIRAAEARDELQDAAVREAELYLAGMIERLCRVGVTDVQASICYGAPVEGIADAARVRRPDLIVMTTHDRSGIGRLVLGSVAEGVLRATTTPLLLLRPQPSP